MFPLRYWASLDHSEICELSGKVAARPVHPVGGGFFWRAGRGIVPIHPASRHSLAARTKGRADSKSRGFEAFCWEPASSTLSVPILSLRPSDSGRTSVPDSRSSPVVLSGPLLLPIPLLLESLLALPSFGIPLATAKTFRHLNMGILLPHPLDRQGSHSTSFPQVTGLHKT